MEQWETPMAGTLRIKNPKTLKRWIRLGWYQREIADGYQFNVGCGRFTTEKCTCTQCRNRTRPELRAIIKKYGDRMSLFEIWAFADMKDKSTEWMFQMMKNLYDDDENFDPVKWIKSNSRKRKKWYEENPNWYKKYE